MESSKTYLTNGGLVTHSDTPQGFALFHSRTSHWPCTTNNWATQYVLYIQFENTGSKATPVVRVFLHATAINDIYDISTATSMAGLLQRMNLSSKYAKKRAWPPTVPTPPQDFDRCSSEDHVPWWFSCTRDIAFLVVKKNDLFVDSSPPPPSQQKTKQTIYDFMTEISALCLPSFFKTCTSYFKPWGK